jgi:hypothetical protein
MKTRLVRSLAVAGLLAAGMFLSGCASFVNNLNEFAYHLDQQVQQQAYEQALQDYYRPRPDSSTSARGIK